MKKKTEIGEMSVEDSMLMVDRALLTLCNELPESLGLSHTPKDQMELSALRAIPCCSHLIENSRKHVILRDWMRVYCEKEDQELHTDLSVEALQKQLAKERKQQAELLKEKHKDLVPTDSEHHHHHRKDKHNQRQLKEKQKQKKKSSNKSQLRQKHSRQLPDSSKRKRKTDSDDDVSFSDESSAASTSSGSSSGDNLSDSQSESLSSSDSEQERGRKRGRGGSKKTERTTKRKSTGSNRTNNNKTRAKPKAGKAPPIEDLVSSDEDPEPGNDLFDTNDPDVYEVESILERRGGDFGQEDQYLVKWVGYPMEEATWEPASNISKDLIDEFNARPVRKGEYTVDQIQDRKTVRDKKTKLKSFQYLVKWFGYDDLTWEPAENLPHNLRRKFDQKYEARKRRRTS